MFVLSIAYILGHTSGAYWPIIIDSNLILALVSILLTTYWFLNRRFQSKFRISRFGHTNVLATDYSHIPSVGVNNRGARLWPLQRLFVVFTLGFCIQQCFAHYMFQSWPIKHNQLIWLQGEVVDVNATKYGSANTIKLFQIADKEISRFWGNIYVILNHQSHAPNDNDHDSNNTPSFYLPKTENTIGTPLLPANDRQNDPKQFDKLNLTDTFLPPNVFNFNSNEREHRRQAKLPLGMKIGQKIRVRAKIKPLHGYENPAGFDSVRWQYSQGIIFKGKVIELDPNFSVNHNLNPRHSYGWGLSAPDYLATNQALKLKLLELSQGKFINALLFADKSYLSQKDRSQLKAWGVSHLFAISGLHIGILAAIIYACCSVAGRLFPLISYFPIKVILSVAMIWYFVLLIGMPVSAVRAAIMLSVFAVALSWRQYINKYRILGLTIVISLTVEPNNILKAGWWLSIAAVLCLMVIASWVRPTKRAVLDENKQNKSHYLAFPILGWFKEKNEQLIKALTALVLIQLLLTTLMLPITLYWLEGIAVFSVINNLVAVPIFTLFIVPCAFISLFIYLFNASLGLSFFYVVDYLLGLTWDILAAIPNNESWLTLDFRFVAISMAVLVLAISLVPCYQKDKRKGSVVLASILGYFFIAYFLVKTHYNPVKLLVMDVGQGTGVLMYDNKDAVLFDLGPVFSSGFATTETVIKKQLAYLPITRLNAVIISHRDADHKGDIVSLHQFMPFEFVNGCDLLDESRKEFTFSQFKLTRLWPTEKETKPPVRSAKVNKINGVPIVNARPQLSKNNLSCVFRMQHLSSARAVLFTGDIDHKVESRLVQMHLNGQINLRSDILLSSHHGSKYGSGYLFLRLVDPDLVIHSAGAYNRFDFPAEETQQRIASLGVRQYSTKEKGAIKIHLPDSSKSPIELKFVLNWTTPYWKRQNPFSIQTQIR